MRLTQQLLAGLVRLVSAPSLPRALRLGRGLGWIYGTVLRYHRADAFDALRRVFPQKGPDEIAGIVRRMYANLGMNLVELCRLSRDAEFQLARHVFHGRDIVHRALERGRGVLILTAHLGNWDLLCTLTPRLGFPLTVITKTMRNAEVHEYWIRLREQFGVRFVPAHNSYRRCLQTLKRNEVVGFILDQNMIDKEGVFVEFFGRPACTSPGLAFMAAQSGAPVVPVFIVRQPDGSHHITAHPLLEPPPDREPATIQAATQLYTRVIEDAIRRQPDQWIWIHRRWKTRPPPVPVGGHS